MDLELFFVATCFWKISTQRFHFGLVLSSQLLCFFPFQKVLLSLHCVFNLGNNRVIVFKSCLLLLDYVYVTLERAKELEGVRHVFLLQLV